MKKSSQKLAVIIAASVCIVFAFIFTAMQYPVRADSVYSNYFHAEGGTVTVTPKTNAGADKYSGIHTAFKPASSGGSGKVTLNTLIPLSDLSGADEYKSLVLYMAADTTTADMRGFAIVLEDSVDPSQQLAVMFTLQSNGQSARTVALTSDLELVKEENNYFAKIKGTDQYTVGETSPLSGVYSKTGTLDNTLRWGQPLLAYKDGSVFYSKTTNRVAAINSAQFLSVASADLGDSDYAGRYTAEHTANMFSSGYVKLSYQFYQVQTSTVSVLTRFMLGVQTLTTIPDKSQPYIEQKSAVVFKGEPVKLSDIAQYYDFNKTQSYIEGFAGEDIEWGEGQPVLYGYKDGAFSDTEITFSSTGRHKIILTATDKALELSGGQKVIYVDVKEPLPQVSAIFSDNNFVYGNQYNITGYFNIYAFGREYSASYFCEEIPLETPESFSPAEFFEGERPSAVDLGVIVTDSDGNISPRFDITVRLLSEKFRTEDGSLTTRINSPTNAQMAYKGTHLTFTPDSADGTVYYNGLIEKSMLTGPGVDKSLVLFYDNQAAANAFAIVFEDAINPSEQLVIMSALGAGGNTGHTVSLTDNLEVIEEQGVYYSKISGTEQYTVGGEQNAKEGFIRSNGGGMLSYGDTVIAFDGSKVYYVATSSLIADISSPEFLAAAAASLQDSEYADRYTEEHISSLFSSGYIKMSFRFYGIKKPAVSLLIRGINGQFIDSQNNGIINDAEPPYIVQKISRAEINAEHKLSEILGVYDLSPEKSSVSAYIGGDGTWGSGTLLKLEAFYGETGNFISLTDESYIFSEPGQHNLLVRSTDLTDETYLEYSFSVFVQNPVIKLKGAYSEVYGLNTYLDIIDAEYISVPGEQYTVNVRVFKGGQEIQINGGSIKLSETGVYKVEYCIDAGSGNLVTLTEEFTVAEDFSVEGFVSGNGSVLTLNVKGGEDKNLQYQFWINKGANTGDIDGEEYEQRIWILGRGFSDDSTLDITLDDSLFDMNRIQVLVRIKNLEGKIIDELFYTDSKAGIGLPVITGIFPEGNNIAGSEYIVERTSQFNIQVSGNLPGMEYGLFVNGKSVAAVTAQEGQNFTGINIDISSYLSGKHELEIRARYNGNSVSERFFINIIDLYNAAERPIIVSFGDAVSEEDGRHFIMGVQYADYSQIDESSASNFNFYITVSGKKIYADYDNITHSADGSVMLVKFPASSITLSGIYHVTAVAERKDSVKDDMVNYYYYALARTAAVGQAASVIGADETITPLTPDMKGNYTANIGDTLQIKAVNASIGELPQASLRYAFYREDASGWVKIKDYGAEDFLIWKPVCAGTYLIQLRIMDKDGGEYEAASSVNYTVGGGLSEAPAITVRDYYTGQIMDGNLVAGRPYVISAAMEDYEGDVFYQFTLYSDNLKLIYLNKHSAVSSIIFIPNRADDFKVYVRAILPQNYGYTDRSFAIGLKEISSVLP